MPFRRRDEMEQLLRDLVQVRVEAADEFSGFGVKPR